MQKKIRIQFIWVIVMVLFCTACHHRKEKHQVKTSSFFDSDSLLSLSLTMDYETFVSDNEGKRYYHWAKISYQDNAKNFKEIRVKVRLRGQLRTDTSICTMPQLKVKFEATEHTCFEQLKTANLVFPCQNNTSDYEQYLLQEYLIYKMYNLFTDNSFRVRLVRLQFINSGTKKDTVQTFAFFRESDSDLARRLKGKEISILPVEEQKINPLMREQMNIFQYLIENDDGSDKNMHNVKLIEKADSILYPVPYDFDLCGLISTPYTDFDSLAFHRDTQVQFSPENASAKFLLQTFAEKQKACLAVFENDTLLSKPYKTKTLLFLRKKFKELNIKQ